MADSSGVAELMTVPGSKAEWLYWLPYVKVASGGQSHSSERQLSLNLTSRSSLTWAPQGVPPPWHHFRY
jgi:hypothetical protein